MNKEIIMYGLIIVLFIISVVFIILYINHKPKCSSSRMESFEKEKKEEKTPGKKVKEYKLNPKAKLAFRVGTTPVLDNITTVHGEVVNVEGGQHLAKVKNLPVNWDWRNTTSHLLYPKLQPGNYCSDVKNQHAAPAGLNGMQYTGTCWIFSSVQTMADRINIMNGISTGKNLTPKVDLSVQPVLSCGGNNVGTMTGGDSYTCYDIILNTTKGLVDTTCMPFLGNDFKNMCKPDCATCLPQGENSCNVINSTAFTSYGHNRCCQVDSKYYTKYKLEGYSNLSARFLQEVRNKTNGWSTNDKLTDYIKTEIYSFGPITIAIDAGPIEAYNLNRGEVFKKRSGEGGYTPELDHLVAIVGWGSYKDGEYWIIRNSWGTAWCDNGYIKVDTKSLGMDDPSDNFFAAYPEGFSKILGVKSTDENVHIQQT